MRKNSAENFPLKHYIFWFLKYSIPRSNEGAIYATGIISRAQNTKTTITVIAMIARHICNYLCESNEYSVFNILFVLFVGYNDNDELKL